MCIRDRYEIEAEYDLNTDFVAYMDKFIAYHQIKEIKKFYACLLYTSDAADERSSVDLGGRRIIKKKKSIIYSIAPSIMKKKRTTKTPAKSL